MAILVDCLEPTNHFRLHIKQMQVDSATVRLADSSGGKVGLMEAFEYPTNEYYVLRSDDHFGKGRYLVEMGE